MQAIDPIVSAAMLTSSASKTESIRVLHVDDDPAILMATKEILSTEGTFEIETVSCVDGAFKKLSTQKYDVIVSDFEMPGKNGLDFLKELKEQKNETPFILFTGKGREEVAIRALNLGAEGYYNKQGDPETVYGELSHGIKQIHEKNKVKIAFDESEAKFKSLADESPNIIFINQKGKVVYTNKKAQEVMGYSLEEFLSPDFDFFSITASESIPTLKEAFSKHMRGEQVAPYEYKVVTKNGSLLLMQINTKLIDYEGDKAILGIVTDITERKKVEQALRDNEEKYKSLFEQAGDYTLVLEVQPDGRPPVISDVSEPALRVHGYSREEIVGKPVNFLDCTSTEAQIKERVQKILKGEKLVFETKHQCKDGSQIDVEISIKKVNVGLKDYFISVERNITERKKMIEELRGHQNMLEAITENLGVGLCTISKDYHVLWVNRFIKNNAGNVEGKQCYSSLNTLDHICPDCGVKKVFEQGAERDAHEYSQIGIDGKRYYVELIATPLKDKEGNVTAALEFVVDIAEKKRREKELTDAQTKLSTALKEAEILNEKLSVAGGFTRHDVGNKLMVIEGNLFLAKKQGITDQKISPYLDQISLASKSITRILEFSKTYESIGSEQPIMTDVGKSIDQAILLFPGLKGSRLVNDCEGFSVMADSMLTTVFHNLIDNSLKYGKNLSTIHIYHNKEPDGSESIVYEDDGGGISPEDKTHLFTKGYGQGTGFGLYLIKRTCDLYGWTIKEIGDFGIGVKFKFNIPSKK